MEFSLDFVRRRLFVPAIIIAHLVCITIAESTTASAATAFDGIWVHKRSHTTPKGLHNEGTDRLAINTSGTSTETLDQIVTMLSGDGRRIAPKIHVVQTRHSLRTKLDGTTLVIRWSSLELMASRSDTIPTGLHVRVGPATARYSLRGNQLAAKFDGQTDIDIFTLTR